MKSLKNKVFHLEVQFRDIFPFLGEVDLLGKLAILFVDIGGKFSYGHNDSDERPEDFYV